MSKYINVGEQAWKKVWNWYYQSEETNTEWCVAFAHYALWLSGVDTRAYKDVKCWGNQINVGLAQEYYGLYDACMTKADVSDSGNSIYDMVKTGDLLLMRNGGHIGVIYVEGDRKYVIHGNIYNSADIRKDGTTVPDGYKRSAVKCHELTRNSDVVATMSINGYISMEKFLLSNTEVTVSSALSTEPYQVGNGDLGGGGSR